MRGDITLERLRSEKPMRHVQCPSRNHWQTWIGLKHEADQAIWNRGGEQLLDGFPERIHVHRCVQAEQSLFQRRIDHRLALHANPGGPLHLPARAASSRSRRSFSPSLRLRSIPKRSTIGKLKKAT